MSRTGVVLFTRDLRVHDNAALSAATRECDTVIPLFVLDDALLGASANRAAFLLDSLRDLRDSLKGALVVRRGDPVAEVTRLQPDAVYVSADVSAYARRREQRLREAASVRVHPGITVAVPGHPAPAGSDHYRVFTPYWRVWRAELPDPAPPARPVRLPDGLDPGPIPAGKPASSLPPGGERAGRRRLSRFLADAARHYGELRDDLAADGTSRLSPYLHFGCVSPAEAARRAAAAGAEEFLRQLCWRDFFAQLLAARPDLGREDLRPARGGWLDDAEGLQAWKEGRTGYPLVDAGMRQLLSEGWMPNRARMVAASFLTKHLLVDWREGAAHFMAHLVDGDVASNAGNWQWVAGTGTDPRPNRVFNPIRQAQRFDPSGEYVRRHAPEGSDREPLVEHRFAVRRYRELRG